MRRLGVVGGIVLALLAADAASAAEQSRHGAEANVVRSGAADEARLAAPVASQAPAPTRPRKRRVGAKAVQKFIKRQAMIVTEAQPAVFPSARLTGRKPWALCTRLRPRREWLCVYHVAVYEESTIDPPAEYDPEWPIRQSIVRFCRAPKHGVLTVRLRHGRLRVVGGWRMACPVEQFSIDLWNKYGPDWAGPNVSEPSAYTRITGPPVKVDHPGEGLLPPPSGEPGGIPPGPLSLTPLAPASRKVHASWDEFLGCTYWYRNYLNTGYWAYACFWRPESLPGASPGIFNNVINYQLYYWAGDRDSSGRAVGRLWSAGIVPQINYVHG